MLRCILLFKMSMERGGREVFNCFSYACALWTFNQRCGLFVETSRLVKSLDVSFWICR